MLLFSRQSRWVTWGLPGSYLDVTWKLPESLLDGTALAVCSTCLGRAFFWLRLLPRASGTSASRILGARRACPMTATLAVEESQEKCPCPIVNAKPRDRQTQSPPWSHEAEDLFQSGLQRSGLQRPTETRTDSPRSKDKPRFSKYCFAQFTHHQTNRETTDVRSTGARLPPNMHE